MKNKETLQTAMDRRLSFLDERPSCRPALMQRIAQEEAPVMKKNISLGLVLALVLVSLSVIAVAAGLILSPRVSAATLADRALESTYGITADMQTFFGREEEELAGGTVRVTYTGAGALEYVLGTYTAEVRDGKAVISWSRDGENTAGGYDADAWGLDQLKQMFAESTDEKSKTVFLEKARIIAEKHGITEDDSPSDSVEGDFEKREADKTSALELRKLSEEEMAAVGRDFIISNYGLNEEQAARMELYTTLSGEAGNEWYETVNGKPCFKVEYLLYHYSSEGVDPANRDEKDGYYIVYVNVETGAVEQYEYNSGLGGLG